MKEKRIEKDRIVNEKYECFEVYKCSNCHTLLHIALEEKNVFYRKMFDFFFSDEKLLRYLEHKTSLQFKPTKENYTSLYLHLQTYLDQENIEKKVGELSEIVKEVLIDEEEIEEKDGILYVRKDKIGKIGEYIFSCILYDYYEFDCIIPKILLTTDPNMNVYGIDVLFYSAKENLLMFGESKFCKNLDNGTKLIKESLSDYEKQLRQEYVCVLSKRLYKNLFNKFGEIYGEELTKSISMDEFIENAGIKKIGIPIFIAHGTELDPEVIINKLKTIKIDKVLGQEVALIVISLPIIDKRECIACFTEYIRERLDEYNEKHK